jgi:alanine racemase
VQPGDEVVLLGEQGDDRIGAQDWADRVGTIPYEILTGIGPRVPREYRDQAGGGVVTQPALRPR